MTESFEVADGHDLVPLRLADRQQDAVVLAGSAAYDDVDLVRGAGRAGSGTVPDWFSGMHIQDVHP